MAQQWSYIGAGAVYSGAASTASVEVPSGIQNGSLLFVVCGTIVSTFSAGYAPTGWTAVYSASQSLNAWYRISDGTETTVSISNPGGYIKAACIAYDKPSLFDVASTYKTVGNATSISTNTLTTSIVDELVISFYNGWGSSASWTAPSSTNSRINSSVVAGFYDFPGLLIVDENKATAGTTTARTGTASTTLNGIRAGSVSFKVNQYPGNFFAVF